MRLPLFLAAVLVLAGCADADAPADAPDAPAEASAPPGSLGSFTLRLAESDAQGAPAAEVAGFLPPPVPADAFPTVDLVDATVFNAGVDETTLPDDFDRQSSHFVYVERKPDGSFDKAGVLNAFAGQSHNYPDNPYSATVGGFTFTPLWPEGAPAAGLTFDTSGDDPQPIGTVGLAVSSRPVWVQPVTLPPSGEAPEVTAEMDFAVDMGDGPTLYLLYQKKEFFAGRSNWGMGAFYPDRTINQGRQRDPAAPTSQAFTISLRGLDEGPTQAYLLVFPE